MSGLRSGSKLFDTDGLILKISADDKTNIKKLPSSLLQQGDYPRLPNLSINRLINLIEAIFLEVILSNDEDLQNHDQPKS